MIRVWIICLAGFLLLPFKVVGTPLTWYGAEMFIVFMLAFCLGAVLVRMPDAAPFPNPPQEIDFSSTDRILQWVAVIAVIVMLTSAAQTNVFDLTEAYRLRSLAASALRNGDESKSSLAFQIGFLTYPASYVYIVRQIVYEKKIVPWRFLAFGVLPSGLATVVMGGRMPFFYAFIMGAIALTARRQYFGPKPKASEAEKKNRGRRVLIGTAVGIGFVGAMIYASQVFLVRAAGAGGFSGMFDIAEMAWGVSFRGPGSEYLLNTIGDDYTFLIMIFVWYLVQGIVMSNYLFTSYTGPPQLGVYGIDLASALMRRIDGGLVANDFAALDKLGTYGFLPSAFGTLWVDYGYVGILVSMAWGYFASVVYRHCLEGKDARWLLVGPFMTMGIIFSIINTPIGLSNGLVVYFWLFVAFRRLKRPAAAESEAGLAPVPA